MSTLGQELRRRREELNIGLREISEETRIGLRFLHAIEADDYSGIPGGIYARSFIRAYAKCVHMDEDEAVNLFRDQTNQSADDEMIELQQNRDFPSEPSQTSLGVAVLVLLAVITLVGYGAVRYFKPADGANAPVQSVSSSPPASKPVENPVEQPAAQPIAAAPANPAQLDAAAQQAAQSDGGLLLAFIATDRSWLSVQSDDNSSAQTMIIQPGESREFKADSKLKVTVGNLLGVQIKINGQPAKFPSGNGLLASNVIISKENYNDYISAAVDPNFKFQKPTIIAPKPANVQTPGAAPNQNPTSTTKPPVVNKPTAGGTSPASANNGTQQPAVKTSVKPTDASKPEWLLEKPSSADGRSGAAPSKPDAQKSKTEPKPSEEPKPAKDSKPEDEPQKD